MTSPRPLSKLTRQELYELIWSTPATKLSEQFGISDVAISKHCKKQNIPRPGRGYWAKVEAGQKPRKRALPPIPEDVLKKAVEQPHRKALRLPSDVQKMHTVATELLKMLNSARRDWQNHKRVRVCEPSVPEVATSKESAEKVAKAFHAILEDVEPYGIQFRKAQSSYNAGHFQRGINRLYFKIEEKLIEPSHSSRGGYSGWQGPEGRLVPSGELIFFVNPDRYSNEKEKRWKECEKLPLRELLSQVAHEIRRYFLEAQQRRVQQAIERERYRVEAERHWRDYQEKEAIRIEEKKKRDHAEKLEAVERVRREDFFKATGWWRLHRAAAEFITACEDRWREQQEGVLQSEQVEWITWARNAAAAVSPFESGYPDARQDGPFNPSEVPFGGPYPSTRKFPQPPTIHQ